MLMTRKCQGQEKLTCSEEQRSSGERCEKSFQEQSIIIQVSSFREIANPTEVSFPQIPF
jgi:hypothetical protein